MASRLHHQTVVDCTTAGMRTALPQSYVDIRKRHPDNVLQEAHPYARHTLYDCNCTKVEYYCLINIASRVACSMEILKI